VSTSEAAPQGSLRRGAVPEVVITVYGTPAPQGSKRAFIGKSGRAHVIESSHDRVKSWRQAVIDEVRASPWTAPALPFTGPLEVEMTFDLRRPKGTTAPGGTPTCCVTPRPPTRPGHPT
jgi:hypothetical protein